MNESWKNRENARASQHAPIPAAFVLGSSSLACAACGNADGNRILELPGEPAARGRGEEQRFFAYSQCGVCSSLLLMETPADIDSYYAGGYYSFDEGGAAGAGLRGYLVRSRNRYEAKTEGLAGRILANLAPFPQLRILRSLFEGRFGPKLGLEARILDVGCGVGQWLRMLRDLGCTDLTGVDPYLDASKTSDGVRLVKGEVADLDGEYDVIFCSHALEHIAEAGEALSGMRARLAAGGVAVISIPLAESYAWKRYGGEWVQLDAPRHVHLFTEAGFRSLAEANGLHVAHVEHNANEFMILGSEARLLGQGPHQTSPDGQSVKSVIKGFSRADRKAAAKIAFLANRLATADQAAFFCRADERGARKMEG